VSQTQNHSTGRRVGIESATLFEAAGLNADGMPIDPEEVYSKTAYRAVLDYCKRPGDGTIAKIAVDAAETMMQQWVPGDSCSPCAPNAVNERTVLGLIAGLHNTDTLEDDLLSEVLSYTTFGSWANNGTESPSEEHIKETLFSVVHRVYFIYSSPTLVPRIYQWAEDNFIRDFLPEWPEEFAARIDEQHAIRVGSTVVAAELPTIGI
jgi:hypothetical protein